MLLRPVDYFFVFWFAQAAASTAYVAWDQYRNNPGPTVVKSGFILVTLNMGPLGLLLYVLADQEPRPGEHETLSRHCGKQGVGSTIHCVAGRHWDYPSGSHHSDARTSGVDRSYVDIRQRVRLRPVYLSIAVHEIDDGWDPKSRKLNEPRVQTRLVRAHGIAALAR